MPELITFEDTWTTFQGTQTMVRCTASPHRDVATKHDKRTALSVSICNNWEGPASRMVLQGYCYAIEFVRASPASSAASASASSSAEVCVADLIESRDHVIHDFIHKIARILVLKYHRPCYVQLSTAAAASDDALGASDQINLLQKITQCIDNHTV